MVEMNDSPASFARRFAFAAITPRMLPSPTFAHWDGEEDVGLSPRTASRVRLVYTLPLYDSPVIRDFIAWRTQPALFTFQIMDLVQWMTLTRATPRMMTQAFNTTGMPLLFWQLNFVLESYAPQGNSTSPVWAAPVPGDDHLAGEMEDEEEEEPSDSQDDATDDCFDPEMIDVTSVSHS